MAQKRIVFGPSHDRRVHKAIEGKTIHKIDTETKDDEVLVTFTDGTALKVSSPRLYPGLHCDLYECQPAQTKLSFTAWSEYRYPFDGELVPYFTKVFREFARYVEGFGPIKYTANYHQMTYLADRFLEEAKIKPSQINQIDQISLEWDWLNTNRREPDAILFSASYQEIYCDVSVDSSVLAVRVYRLDPLIVNSLPKTAPVSNNRFNSDI